MPIFDEIGITNQDGNLLRDFVGEVARMPTIQYNEVTGEVVADHREHYNRFTTFVWDKLWSMPVGQFLRQCTLLGKDKKGKRSSVFARSMRFAGERVMYVGDSETDVQCVELLRGTGLTMMFNGKGRVCNLSDVTYIGQDARAISEVAERFAQLGRERTIAHYARPLNAQVGGILAAVTRKNINKLRDLSEKERKEFRGVAIGSLHMIRGNLRISTRPHLGEGDD